MKLLNGLLIVLVGLILVGVIYFMDQDRQESTPKGSNVTAVLSLDHDIFQINQEEKIIYILVETTKDDVFDKLVADDGSPQVYRITTSEGSDKSHNELYDYDRLYVLAENNVDEDYYHFELVSELD